jgi:UDP:flavonoid glycosyltransferase YjiC (YdhE family)
MWMFYRTTSEIAAHAKKHCFVFPAPPDNGRRIVAVGARLALSAPDASALRAAIVRVLDDAELRRGARRIADEMAALPNIESAVDVLVGMTAR